MTIKEAIDKADNLNPNQYEDVIKVSWLSDLDHQLYLFMKDHEDAPEDEFIPYTINDVNKELLVGSPYGELYTAYLDMKVDEANKETARYNNSVIIFNAKYQAFTNHYHSTHKPLMKTKFRLW